MGSSGGRVRRDDVLTRSREGAWGRCKEAGVGRTENARVLEICVLDLSRSFACSRLRNETPPIILA
uniref:Uncharacterized protein n=1 Tax=Hyaloperonospora arabidopsidis (strain Emoy2) TaxID=559515 RepID=M4BBA7_HYAAE